MTKENKDRTTNVNNTAPKDKKVRTPKQTSTSLRDVNGLVRTAPIIMVAAAIFLTICYFSKETGAFGKFISDLFMGLFSYMAYAIPLLILFHAIFFIEDYSERKLLRRFIASLILLVNLAMLAYIISVYSLDLTFSIKSSYTDGMESAGGGFFGNLFGFVIGKLIGKAGVIIVIALTVLLYAIYNFSAGSGIKRFILKGLTRFADLGARLEAKSNEKKKKRREDKIAKKLAADDKRNAELYNDNYFNADNGISRLEIPELGIVETKDAIGEINILRERVGNIVTEAEEEAYDEPDNDSILKHFKGIDIPDDTIFVRSEGENDGFRADDIVYEARTFDQETDYEPDYDEEELSKKSAASSSDFVPSEDSAESVFTDDFDPYDIALNERLAEKQSSRAAESQKNTAYSEFVSDISPEERRIAEEFERNRLAALARRAEREAKEALEKANVNNVEAPAAAPLATVIDIPEQKAAYQPESVPSSDNREDAFLRAEEERRREQAMLADLVSGAYSNGTSESESYSPTEAPAASSPSGIITETKTGEAPVSTETKFARYGMVAQVASENIANESNGTPRTNENKYRFALNTENEQRIPYSSGEPTSNIAPESPRAPYSQHAASPYTATESAPTSYNAAAMSYEAKAPSVAYTPASYTEPRDTEARPVASAAPMSYTSTAKETFTYTAEKETPISVNTTEKAALDFEETDYDNDFSTPINTVEFNFSTRPTSANVEEINAPLANIESAPAVTPIDAPPAASRLEVTRTMIEQVTEDDEDEDEDEDENEILDEVSDEYAEEAVAPVEIPEEERNPVLDEYKGMFDIFKNSSSKKEERDASTLYDVLEEHPDGMGIIDDSAEDGSTGYRDAAADVDPTEVIVATSTEDSDDEGYDTDANSEDDVNAEEYGSEDGEDYDGDEEYDGEDDDEPPFDAPTVKPMPEIKKEEPPKPKAPDYSNYRFPPIDLLKKGTTEDSDEINDEITRGGEQLVNTLESFNIKTTMRGVERGPRITRYSLVPAKGIRVNQIEKLSDDLALAMAAESIRIEAPIPGKSAVGIEVPNKKPSIVSLRDLLEDPEFTGNPSKTTVCIGKSVEGTHVFGDLGSMPHLLIAGATGMGKSVCINALITSILYKARPDEVKFIMIDPKKVEFAPYNGIPHLLVPVVTEPKQAAGALVWAVDEMNKRYDIIEKLCVRGIDSYNEKVAENPELGAPMSKIIIFIDELNDLMIQVRDPVENLIMSIAQKARAAGIHLVIGTQRPSVNVITGVIKANIPSRIACKVSSGIDSRTILEQVGAEKLIGKGDMLYHPGGKPTPKRVQGAYVSESETASVVEFVKKQARGNLYDEQALEDMKRAAQKCDKDKNKGDDYDDDMGDGGGAVSFQDRKFISAVELAIKNGSVATSFLQRKLRVGYSKAAQYIDEMEAQGIVGEKNGAKARDVLMTMDEWQELLARRTDY